MSLLPFLALNVSVALLSMQGQKALRFHQKYLNLCSEDEQRSYGFGMTWGWVINDRIFIFGWTIPLTINIIHGACSQWLLDSTRTVPCPWSPLWYSWTESQSTAGSEGCPVCNRVWSRGDEGQHLQKSEAVVPSWKKVDFPFRVGSDLLPRAGQIMRFIGGSVQWRQ